MKERLREAAQSAAERVTYATVAFGLSNPVAFAAIVVGAVVLLVVGAWLFVSSTWKYLMYAAALYLVYWVVSQGVLSAAVEELRSNPRRYIWLGILLVAVGVAVPYMVEPQTYVDGQLTLYYELTSGSGIFGFVTTTVDVNSLQAEFSVVRSYEGAPLVHPVKTVPDASSEPGDGWWVCLQEVTPYERYSQYCWQIPGVSILTRAVASGVHKQGYFIKSLPIHAREGAFVVTVYSDRTPVWQRSIAYVVGSRPVVGSGGYGGGSVEGNESPPPPVGV